MPRVVVDDYTVKFWNPVEPCQSRANSTDEHESLLYQHVGIRGQACIQIHDVIPPSASTYHSTPVAAGDRYSTIVKGEHGMSLSNFSGLAAETSQCPSSRRTPVTSTLR
jgi:hypothetical protein